MNDLSAIEAAYKNMHTDELLQLAANPSGLRVEVIPVLQKELLSRNKQNEALELSRYLVEKPASLRNTSPEDLLDMVKSRMDSGEPLESIKIDLKERGVNLYDLLNREDLARERIHDYVVSLKNRGLSDEEVNVQMQETFDIGEAEASLMNTEVRQKGTRNIVIGVSIVALLLLLLAGSIASGSYRMGFGVFIIFGLGIWLIVKGVGQRG